MYPLGTWFVSGICVWIPSIKETMMMMMMVIIIRFFIFSIQAQPSQSQLHREQKNVRKVHKQQTTNK